MKLSTQQQSQLLELRGKFIKALESRSRNPNDFDTNVNFLQEHASLLRETKALITPYFDRGLSIAMSNYFGFVKSFKIKRVQSQYNEMIEKANAFMFDNEEFKSLLEKEFKDKPIKLLGTHQEINVAKKTSSRTGFFPQVQEECSSIYKITFSDNSVLSWCPDDPTDTSCARATFDDKIHQPKARSTGRRITAGFSPTTSMTLPRQVFDLDTKACYAVDASDEIFSYK